MSQPIKRRCIQTLQSYYQELSKNQTILAVLLYGSQNYHLDTPFSDIDAYAIVLPDKIQLSFETKGKLNPTSTLSRKVKFPTGNVTMKTLAEFMQMFLKQGISTLETLYSPYQVINPDYQQEWDNLISKREIISQFDVYHQILIAHSMLQNELDQFITDYTANPDQAQPKQLARACHMFAFMTERIQNKSFYEALDTAKKDYHEAIMKLKTKTDILKDTSVLDLAKTLKKQDTHRWNKYKDSHASLSNDDPAILKMQEELSDCILPILWKHIDMLCHPKPTYNTPEECPHFEAIETNPNDCFDYPSYTCFCNYGNEHKHILPSIHCTKCTKGGKSNA